MNRPFVTFRPCCEEVQLTLDFGNDVWKEFVHPEMFRGTQVRRIIEVSKDHRLILDGVDHFLRYLFW